MSTTKQTTKQTIHQIVASQLFNMMQVQDNLTEEAIAELLKNRYGSAVNDKPTKGGKAVSKKPRKRAEKDDTKPKRALTAFFCFSKENRESVRDYLGDDVTIGSISRELSSRWRALTD